MENAALKNLSNEKLENENISFKRFGSFRYLGQDHYVEIPLEKIKYTKDSIRNIISEFNNTIL